jgi:D-glycero-D-manno-heptose 1,7-bisphosphate phosphatase
MSAAVFLDRDGTIIEEVGYLNLLDRVAFFPWTVDAIRALNAAGFRVIVVTNQAGVAQGYYDEAFVRATHALIDQRVRDGGAQIDAFYYCPHHPEGRVPQYRTACECRKPAPGLIHRAEREFGIDPSRSFVVGDRWRDVEFGRAAGARSILVRTGHGLAEEARPEGAPRPDLVADNLVEAVAWILRNGAGG